MANNINKNQVFNQITELQKSLESWTALEEFEVPAAVTELPSQTFQDCAYLKTLKLNRFGPDGSITVMSSGNVLKNCSSLEEIIVPEGSVEAYGNAENWNAYIEIIKSY